MRKYKMDTLDEKQLNAFQSMLDGKNVFITGPGGSGKSYVIHLFIEYFRKYIEDEVNRIYVTSSTGLSALLIQGITIHQFSGLGSATKSIEYYVDRIKKNKNIRNRWLYTKTLIIDEVSMISDEFFEKLDILGQKIRKNKNPF